MNGKTEFPRDVLNRIGAGVALVDPHNRILEWVNPAAAELFGATTDQIIGQPCQRFLCPADSSTCPILDQGKDADHAEQVLRRHDGRELPVMKSVKRILIDGKEKLVETFVDLSARKRAEVARREREDRYRALFETSRDAMMVLAMPAGNFVSANAATLELFGAKDEATFTALTPWALSPATQPDGRPSADKAREMIDVAMREGSHGFEWRHSRLDGREFPASVLLTRLEFAGQRLVQATIRDMSPTELALSALRDSEERLRLAVEATGMGTYHWDHSTGKIDYSPEFLALYDLPPNGTLPLGPDLIPVVVLDEDRPIFQAAMAAGNDPRSDGVMEAEFRIRRPDGSIRWLMARGRTAFDSSPGVRRPTRAAGMLMDITERKRADEALRRYEMLARHSRDTLFFVRRHDGRILDANDAAFAAYGYTRDEMLSLSIRDLRAPDMQPLTEAQMALADSVGLRFETVHQRKDGSTFPVEVSAAGATIGRVRTLMSVVRDISERKRVEETLRDSEERLDQIFNSASNGMAFSEPESGKLLNVNDTWVRQTGICRSDAIGKTAFELGLWPSKDKRDAFYATLFREGRLLEYEATLLCRGVERHFAFNVEFVNLRLGRFLLWELRDITERKRADQEIALLKHSIDVHFDAAYWTDSEGRILYVNQAGHKALGFEHGELIGKTLLDVNPKSTPDRLKKTWEILRAEGAYRVESAHRRKDGSEFPVEIQTSHVRFDGKEYSCGFARDISERRRAEAALRESEEKFRASFMTGLDAVFWARLENGQILEVNRVFEILSGYSRAEAIGRTAHELGLYCDPGDRSRMVSEVREKGFVRDLEFKIRQKGGQIVTVSFSASLVLSSSQQFLFGMARDITERKLAEEETARLTSQLQQAQKMESVGRLAGGVAHDFNNMLGVILGHCELALEKVNASDSLHGDLVNIQAAAQRSADLTRQLLAFARKQTVAPKVLSLNDTVSGMLKMVKRLLGEDVELEWRPGKNLWPVKIDPTQIDQILANLCVNARDAIANVGKIAIETGTKVRTAESTDAPAGAAPGHYVWLSVTDDGCGMDQATLTHVFEPFFTTKEVGKGTGLGLATVYGIVKQNNGFIDLRSEPGQGTVFTIYLPRHVEKSVREQTDATALTIQPGQETILLVEDEAPLLAVTHRMMEKCGYNVLTASTPGQAIQIAREHPGKIDLLITDVVMPEMNGRDLAKNFLSLHPQAKRLFMSGYTADVIAHQGVLDEGVFFIQKPFSAKDLAAMVRQVLGDGGAKIV